MNNREPEHLIEMIAPPGKFFYGVNNELLVPEGITIFYLSADGINPSEEARNYYVKVDDQEILLVYSESQLFSKFGLANTINSLTQHYSDYQFPDNPATSNPEDFQDLLKKIEDSILLKEFIVDTCTKIQNDGWNRRTNEEIPVGELMYAELGGLTPIQQRLLGIEKFNYAEHISKYTISLKRDTFETNFKNTAIELKPKTLQITANELLKKYNFLPKTLHSQPTQTPTAQLNPKYTFDDDWVHAVAALETTSETSTLETPQIPQEITTDEKTLLFQKLSDPKLSDEKLAFNHVIFLIETKIGSTKRDNITLDLNTPAHTALSGLTPNQRTMLGIGDLIPFGTSQYKTVLTCATAKAFLEEWKEYKERHCVSLEKKNQVTGSQDADALEKMKEDFKKNTKHYNPRKFNLNAGQKIKYIEDERSEKRYKRHKK